MLFFLWLTHSGSLLLFLAADALQDGYKIIDFGEDNLELDGTVLRGQCIRSSKGVSDHCLRWHFRQAVLANMRGDGEPLAVDRFSFTL
jgi:hypothetical protein